MAGSQCECHVVSTADSGPALYLLLDDIQTSQQLGVGVLDSAHRLRLHARVCISTSVMCIAHMV
ncbi:hypothetical protein C8Q74DRAFT_1276297 [Fomes fomentarius]|nr:hypothetical protein C8Q74DRAFT_1276297 [Fomes fomentarius]